MLLTWARPPGCPGLGMGVGWGGKDDGGTSAVLAPFVAAAARRKWAACGHGAKVLEGGWGSNQFLCPPQCQCPVEVNCWALAARRQAGYFSQGGLYTFQGLGPGRGLSIRGVSGGSLPLGYPGSGFRVGLTSPPAVACPAPALPVRGAVPGQWVRLTDQASHCQG